MIWLLDPDTGNIIKLDFNNPMAAKILNMRMLIKIYRNLLVNDHLTTNKLKSYGVLKI